MTHHLVLGAGLIGSELTRQLLGAGDTVTVASRSGTQLPRATARALHANDEASLRAAAGNAATIFVCVNPAYAAWTAEWPPIFDAVTVAAQYTGAKVVLMGNLYGHGRPTRPMTAHDALSPVESKGRVRAEGWNGLLAAHNRGDVRAVEVRASDYFGPGAGPTAHLGRRFFRPLIDGKTAWCVGGPAQPHAWAYLPDIARTLVAAAGAPEEHWGRAWLVDSHSYSRLEVADQVAKLTGATGRVRSIPPLALHAVGVLSPMAREVARSAYQFTSPFLVDASETAQVLGVAATPWATALEQTVAAYEGERRD